MKFSISESGPASLEDGNGGGGNGGNGGPVYGAAYHPLGEDIGVSMKFPQLGLGVPVAIQMDVRKCSVFAEASAFGNLERPLKLQRGEYFTSENLCRVFH